MSTLEEDVARADALELVRSKTLEELATNFVLRSRVVKVYPELQETFDKYRHLVGTIKQAESDLRHMVGSWYRESHF